MKKVHVIGLALVIVGFGWVTKFSVIDVLSDPGCHPRGHVTLIHFEEAVPAHKVNQMIHSHHNAKCELFRARLQVFPPAVLMLLGSVLLVLNRRESQQPAAQVQSEGAPSD